MDWSRFTLKINVECTPVQAYNKWSTAAELESWFLKSARFADKNGNVLMSGQKVSENCQYIWQWYTYDKYVGTGKITKTNYPELMEFSFIDMIVRLDFTNNTIVKNETIISLTQYNIPIDDESKMNLYSVCKTAWAFHLTNLKSVLEGGPDLRGISTPGMLNN